MKSLKNILILNVFVYLISSSAGKSLLKKRDASDDYDDAEPLSNGDQNHSNEDSEECQETFTPHIQCEDRGVLIVLSHDTHDGKFYVNEYSQDHDCMHAFSKSARNTSLNIPFGKCGLEKKKEVLMNITILPHDQIVGGGAKTILARCPYESHNSTVSEDLPYKEIPYRPDQLVNATGPPAPTYTLTIKEQNPHDPNKKGNVIAEIHISSHVEDARAKNCYVIPTNDTNAKYELTNEHGCPTHPDVFPGWQWDKNTQKLTSKFKSFGLIDAEKIRIFCTVETCHTKSDCGPPCPQADSQRRKCPGKSH